MKNLVNNMVVQLVEHKTGDGRVASSRLIADRVTVVCP